MRSFRGFTLTELAVVLVIISLLIGTLVIPLGTQQDLRRTADTQKILSDVRDALVGYAAANGRLPCPASSGGTSGTESFTGTVGASACSSPYDGYVPGTTLGIGPTDSNGIVIDAWNNKIRYAVTAANSNAFTSTYVASPAAGMKGIGLSTLAPDLYVCTSSTGITSSSCGTATALTTNAVAVIFSTASNTATGGTGNDEAANLNADKVFVYHEPTPTTATNGEFDDIVIWLSPNILYNRMIAAGQLP